MVNTEALVHSIDARPKDKAASEPEEILRVNGMDLFEDEVLMQGSIQKRGLKGLQLFKQRYLVLRGRTLFYYRMSGEPFGKLKGHFVLTNASAIPAENKDSLQFQIKMIDEKGVELRRDFKAPSVQAMSDWVCSINAAATAHIITPPAHQNLMHPDRTTRIILIRHGQYENVGQSVPEIEKQLTPLGIEQAERTGRYLATYFHERLVDSRFPSITVHHSDLQRAIQTASIIAHHFPQSETRVNPYIREAWPCDPLPGNPSSEEMKEVMVEDTSRLKVAFGTLFNFINPHDVRRPSTVLPPELVQQFEATFNPASTSVRVNDRYRIIVCHANVIRWFVTTALGIEPDGNWGKFQCNHCSLTCVDIASDGRYQLGFLNQTSHLPSHMITEC